MKNVYFKLSIFFISFALLTLGCKKTNDKVVHVIKDEYNVEDQNEIGKAIKKLLKSNPNQFLIMDRDENIPFYNYINTLLQMLVNTDHVENRLIFEWDVSIIHDDNIVAAFTAPGGKLFIYTGLLKFITSENELFSILAHEINYADKSNLTEQLVSQYGKDVIGDLLLGYDLPTTRNVAFSIKDFIFSEEEVLVADKYAIDLICPFQYDAFGLQTILEKAHASNFEIYWLITRPSAVARLESIKDFAKNCGEEEQTFTERYAEFKALLP